jgi:carnitine 3-dehydrogenase
MAKIKTVGIAGTGLIGAGWAARLLIRGFDVIAYDVVPSAEAKLKAAIDVAWPSMSKLLGATGRRGKLCFTTDLAEMASKSDFIHEAAPEREDLKIRLFSDIDAVARPEVIIASSSSGFLPTRLQSECVRNPERVIIGHPFNPVYLLPLVETVPGEKTSSEAMDRAGEYFEAIGMHVLRLKKEIEGYICDRLQEALWREALHILNKDVGTTGDIDDSIIYSAGMRWAFMGSFLTYHVAGGPGGMRHFISQFDPTLELPWTDLKFPKWNKELETRLIEGCEAQAAGQTVAQIEAKRNDVLVDMMRLFKHHGVAAGNVLAREEECQGSKAKRWKKADKIESPVKLHKGEVLSAWLDYNGHMTDAAYLTAFGDGLDAFFRYIGDDEAYRATGNTFFTAETHVNYYREMKLGDPFWIETQVVGADEKRMHLFHRMYHGKTKDLVAVNEIMQLHVNQKEGRVAPMAASLYEALSAIAKAHKKLKKPKELGSVMQVKRKKK